MLVTTVDILNVKNGAAMRAKNLMYQFDIKEVCIISFFKNKSVIKMELHIIIVD